MREAQDKELERQVKRYGKDELQTPIHADDGLGQADNEKGVSQPLASLAWLDLSLPPWLRWERKLSPLRRTRWSFEASLHAWRLLFALRIRVVSQYTFSQEQPRRMEPRWHRAHIHTYDRVSHWQTPAGPLFGCAARFLAIYSSGDSFLLLLLDTASSWLRVMAAAVCAARLAAESGRASSAARSSWSSPRAGSAHRGSGALTSMPAAGTT
jgi:hypothetical protein